MNGKLSKYIRASLKASGVNPQQTSYVASSVIKNTPRMRPGDDGKYGPAPLEVVGAVNWLTITHEPVVRVQVWLDDRAGRARYRQVKRVVKGKYGPNAGGARRPKPHLTSA